MLASQKSVMVIMTLRQIILKHLQQDFQSFTNGSVPQPAKVKWKTLHTNEDLKMGNQNMQEGIKGREMHFYEIIEDCRFFIDYKVMLLRDFL